ncbi:hypothetical protein [Kribbella sp. CA-247076]|uniref:hypothetical protein n=1 Tax=Kribbella sp. CA-247076 TaxID=3239941 RepID=UPI003D94EB5E
MGRGRAGAQALLLEPVRHLSGMVSGGLGYTDLGDGRVLGEPAREFMLAIDVEFGTQLTGATDVDDVRRLQDDLGIAGAVLTL